LPDRISTSVFVVVPPGGGIPTATTLLMVGLALVIPVATYLALEGRGFWRRRRVPATVTATDPASDPRSPS
jgi:hypothetical protein